MNTYIMLDSTEIDIGALPEVEQEFYHRMKEHYDAGMGWIEFGNLWISEISKVCKGKSPAETAASPLFRVCQDMESRIALREGHAREASYRDLLADLISRNYPSRYQFCKETGLDQGFLSSVLKGRKDLSLSKLEEILSKTNHRIAFVKRKPVPDRN